MAQTLRSLKSGYQLLFDSCLISTNRAQAVNAAVAKIRANRERYEAVGSALGVPWYVVGLIHTMESGGNFSAHLHNGDPLTARTTHVPAGRPKAGTPPFSGRRAPPTRSRYSASGRWKDWSVPGRSTSSRPTTAGATARTTRT